MQIERVALESLVLPEQNVRIHNAKQLAEIGKSLSRFGQIRPIVIDEANVVWCGNGLVMAARQNGVQELDAYRVVGLSEQDKKKLMLADNRTYALGFDNSKVIEDMMHSFDDFDIPGFDSNVLEQLYGGMDKAVEEMGAYGTIPQEAVDQLHDVEEKWVGATEAQISATPTPAPAPMPAQGGVAAAEAPREVQTPQFTGMVNAAKSANERPFIICPKCGEKIWV